MDKFVQADILAACNSLGTEIAGKYVKSSDCVNCLKDILQYTRKDVENHKVQRFLGSLRLLQNDLLPLFKGYIDDSEIFDYTLKLLVVLTSPALVLFEEDVPEDKESQNVYLELNSYLQSYKKAFAFDPDIFKVLFQVFEKYLNEDTRFFSEVDLLKLERLIVIVRNILHIPTEERACFQTDDDKNMHDRILLNMHAHKIDCVLLYLCSIQNNELFCLHLGEIFFLMLHEYSPESIVSADVERTELQKQKDVDILMEARKQEEVLKQKKIKSISSSRFTGVYSVKNMKSISDKDYISHKFIKSIDEVKFDQDKVARIKPKNRLPVQEANKNRHSTIEVRKSLKFFCMHLLQFYNRFMATTKKELLRKASKDHDDIYFLWMMQYFMMLNRLSKLPFDYVAETVSFDMFHQIQSQITTYHDMMFSDKKKSKLWSKRMRFGVSAYKELLRQVFEILHSKQAEQRQAADQILSKVCYQCEYREMLFSLLTHFDEVKFSLVYLSELVVSTYTFLKMLQEHVKTHSTVLIQKKKRQVKRRKKKAKINDDDQPQEDLNTQWDNLASELSALVQGRRPISCDDTPFDGASEVSFEEQKVEAIYKVRNSLLENNAEQAVSLLRAARELWPEGNSFGAPDMESEDEYDVLREIFLTDLPSTNQRIEPEVAERSETNEETDEENEPISRYTEQKLDITEIYKKCASPKVVHAFCLLLANYQMNTAEVNISLIKLLHKISWDCKMHALFFQSTVFLTFQKIFNDPTIHTDPLKKEFYRFAKFIVGKFFKVAQKNNKVFVELLFWKGAKEAYELEEGYNTSEGSNIRGAWAEDEEEELTKLYEENKDIHIEGRDVADIILANLNKGNRTKHQVISALKRLNLIESAKDLKPHLRKEWLETEVVELTHLFSDHKDANNIMEIIINGLSIKRSKKAIIGKLIELNLIQDRKEVHKKKQGKKKSKDMGAKSNSDSDHSEFENETEMEDPHYESSDDDEKFLEMLRNEKQNSLSSLVEGQPNEAEKNEVWDEKEIAELCQIYNLNKDSGDVLSILVKTLTIKRSKRSIIEKMVHLGLIDEKELRDELQPTCIEDKLDDNDEITKTKKKKRREIVSDSENSDNEIAKIKQFDISSEGNKQNQKSKKKSLNTPTSQKKTKKISTKFWEEQEIMQLQQLYKSNMGSVDIIGNIMGELSKKRSKESIIEKLLEIGIIKDRKEIRKKRKDKKTLRSPQKEKRKGNLTKKVDSNGHSSEDETLPIISLTKHSKKQDYSKSLFSDDDHGNSSLLEMEDSISSKNKNKYSPQSSETEVNEELNDGTNVRKSLKKRKRIISESSDDEVLLNSLDIIKSTEQSPETNSDSHFSSYKHVLSENSLVTDNLIKPLTEPNNTNSKFDKVSKRKRARIDDSDESND